MNKKKDIHKFGCLCFTLQNLPPSLNSLLMNIHLISLFHNQDAKKCGIDKILLLMMLRMLENSGVKLSFTEQHFYDTVAQVTGENLSFSLISWLC